MYPLSSLPRDRGTRHFLRGSNFNQELQAYYPPRIPTWMNEVKIRRSEIAEIKKRFARDPNKEVYQTPKK